MRQTLRWIGAVVVVTIVGANSAVAAASQSAAVAAAASQRGSDRCELPEAPSACVFVVSPYFASEGEDVDLSDANDFLVGVELQGLDETAEGYLVGDHVNVGPAINPERTLAAEPDSTWGAGRGERGFEAQNTYYWIDYSQRLIQRLGFDDVRNDPMEVVVLDQTMESAFYSPADRRIYLGTDTEFGGINEGEDGDTILHEYGHAVLDDVSPLLTGAGTDAYHEAFGNILAYLTTLELRLGDAECLFYWSGQQCINRMDEQRVYPTDLVQQPHQDSLIYSGAIYDILVGLLDAEGIDVDDCPGSDACNDVRDRLLTTVMASNYYVTPGMTLPDVAGGFLLANDAQYGGADDDLIEAAFAEHGLIGGSGSIMDSSGDAGGTNPEAAIELSITHPYRGDLSVRYGVVDGDGVDLCPAQVLVTPDPADDGDGVNGVVDVSASPCAEFLPPSPDQQWYLLVEDTLAVDDGELVSFTVNDDGVPYPAPGLPLPIADVDPTGTVALVAGSTGVIDGAGFGTVDGSAPYVTAAITHTYHGDLSIRAGVVDSDGAILCSMTVLEPDPSDSTGGTLGGDVDMSECESFYPPTPERQWFLAVADTAGVDEGTIDQFTLSGPDGATFDFSDLPAALPDADVDGVALLLDGTTGSQGQAGGAGQESAVPLPRVSIDIRHSYAGDLLVSGGVVDGEGATLCRVTLHTPDASDNGQDLVADVSLSECVEHYPPSPERQWFLDVVDTLSIDEGTVESFSLFGPDGIVYRSPDVGVAVPDADPDGVHLVLDGDEAFSGLTAPTVSVVISHPYAGDISTQIARRRRQRDPTVRSPTRRARHRRQRCRPRGRGRVARVRGFLPAGSEPALGAGGPRPLRVRPGRDRCLRAGRARRLHLLPRSNAGGHPRPRPRPGGRAHLRSKVSVGLRPHPGG